MSKVVGWLVVKVRGSNISWWQRTDTSKRGASLSLLPNVKDESKDIIRHNALSLQTVIIFCPLLRNFCYISH